MLRICGLSVVFFLYRLVHQELLQRRCKAEFKEAVHLNKFLSLLKPSVILNVLKGVEMADLSSIFIRNKRTVQNSECKISNVNA